LFADRLAFEFIMFEFERVVLVFDRFVFPFDIMLVLVTIGVDVGNGVAFVITLTFEFAFRIFAFKLTFVSPHADINAPIDVSVQARRIFLISGLLSELNNRKAARPRFTERKIGGPSVFGLRRSRPGLDETRY
jgi:hypothetical protein